MEKCEYKRRLHERLHKLIDEPMTLDYSELDSFVILIGLKGEGTITDNEGNTITLQAGESILVPATTETLKVEGTIKFLETYV